MIKILSIAPYENLKKKLDTIALSYPDIQLESYVGDLSDGVDLVKEKEENFDIIISRGGTAQEIKKISKRPVIEVDISILDILRIIKMVESYSQDFAFIGFANITKQVTILSEILDKQFNIVTIENRNQVHTIVNKLKENGYSLIIGDKITTQIAMECGINTILIESGDESIEAAIKDAIVMGNAFAKKNKEQYYEKFIIDHLEIIMFVLDSNKNILFTNTQNYSKSLVTTINRIITVLDEKRKEEMISYKKVYGKLYSIEVLPCCYGYIAYVKELAVSEDINPLIVYEEKNIEDSALSNSSVFVGKRIEKLKQLLKTNSNIVIYGEGGTGKESVKKIILNEPKENNYWTINLSGDFTKYEWNHLLNAHTSILYDNNTTFFVEGITDSKKGYLYDLIRFIESSSVSSNQWIFLVTLHEETRNSFNILNKAGRIIPFKLEALKNRSDEIGSLISLYVYEFKTKYNKNVIGFEPSALELMKSYHWPGNVRQLKKIIEEMVVFTPGSFISKSTVIEYLNQTEKEWKIQRVEDTFNWDEIRGKSLEDIKKIVIRKLLAYNKGNKTKTASDLQISRSTLWRYLEKI